MRPSIPPLSALLAFESAARHGSFKQAAVELSLTPSAISHQIASLENTLNTTLFLRHGRQMVLSAAGNEYLGRLRGALDTISLATDIAKKGEDKVLHIHASPSFASLWLMPRLADFALHHPDISLSLSSSVVHSDFSSDSVDMDIRYGFPNWPHLHVEPVFEERIAPMASPAFLKKHHVRTPEDLIDLPLIQSVVNVVQWRDWFVSRGLNHSPARFAYRFDRTAMTLDAAVQGLGVAFDSTQIAADLLAEKRLERLFVKDWSLKVHAHFIVLPSKHLQKTKVARFIQWLHAHTGTREIGHVSQ